MEKRWRDSQNVCMAISTYKSISFSVSNSDSTLHLIHVCTSQRGRNARAMKAEDEHWERGLCLITWMDCILADSDLGHSAFSTTAVSCTAHAGSSCKRTACAWSADLAERGAAAPDSRRRSPFCMCLRSTPQPKDRAPEPPTGFALPSSSPPPRSSAVFGALFTPGPACMNPSSVKALTHPQKRGISTPP